MTLQDEKDLEWLGYRKVPKGWAKPFGYSLITFDGSTIKSSFISPVDGSVVLWEVYEVHERQSLKEALIEFEAYSGRPTGGGELVDMGFNTASWINL